MISIKRCESIQQGMQRLYKFSQLIKQLQILLFMNNNIKNGPNDIVTSSNKNINHHTRNNSDSMMVGNNSQSSIAVNNNQSRYYFFGSPQAQQQPTSPTAIKEKQILKLLLEIKKSLGKQVFHHLEQIKAQIAQKNLNTNYLKYLYGILKMASIQQEYITRQLIWVYSLCFGNYQKQSLLFKQIIQSHQRVLVMLGMNILASQNDRIKHQLSLSQEQARHNNSTNNDGFSISSPYLKRPQKRFKKCMIDYIKICQSHISVNLMHAHLEICQSINQKQYLQQKIQQAGKQLLQIIKQQVMQYDYLDQRADTKLFFNRVYQRLGERNVIFAIKQDQMELGEVVEQFSLSHNSTIKNIVDMLKKYHDNVLAKVSLQGYDSDQCPRVTSQKSKLKSTKYLSRNSIRLSSNSLNNHDSDSRSTGSQKHIRCIDESFTKSAKNFHTLDDFAIIKLLGKGAYSQVYLVKNTTTDDLFAMKVVEVESINTDTIQALKKQQQIYKKISSQFAIQLYQSFSDENLHFFLLQYASGGNLRHLLQQECYFDQESARLYLANLILALEQIHHMGIIHRDLKPENIVIDEEGFLKLTDFNLAFMLTANQQQPQDGRNFFGSPDYIAPQVIKSQLNHPSRDIWSLGIIAYEIMIGVTPFTAMQVQQVFQNILKGQIQWPQIGTQQGMISQQAKQFIQSLLQPNPYNRLGYGDITKLKQHKFFKNINWSNIRQHKPYFIPKHESISLEQNPQLKQKLLERKTTEKSSSYFPSLGNIIRYDILKSKSSLKAKSTRKSRFKMQKQLNELKVLTSMDSFPPPIASSQKSLDSNLSSAVFQSQDHQSNTTIELNNVSYRSIQPGAVGTQRNEILQQNIQTIKQVPQNYEIKITTPEEISELKNEQSKLT